MVGKIREVERKLRKKKATRRVAFFCSPKGKSPKGEMFGLKPSGLRTHFLRTPDLVYQILIRSSGFLYNLSPGFTSKALYQASMFTGAPIVRYWLGE
jgi:hypothetical protein